MKKSLAVCSVSVVLAALAGCSKPFPERLGWYGDHPNLYSVAFTAAVDEAIVRQRSGLGFYEHMGDAAFTIPMSGGVCSETSLDAYITAKSRGCWVLSGPPLPDCLNAAGCAGFHYDRNLLAKPDIRRAVEAAIARPCEFLTAPDQVPYARNSSTTRGVSAYANWRIMLCDGPGVHGRAEWDDSEEVVRISFQRGLDA